MHIQFSNIPRHIPFLEAGDAEEVRLELQKHLGAECLKHQTLAEFLIAVSQASPYLKDCLLKEVDFFYSLLANGFDASLEDILASSLNAGMKITSENDFMVAIRKSKRRLALLCGLADLGGWWEGARVTKALSQFANASLSACLDFVLLKAHGDEKLKLANPGRPQEECGFIVLGMGKLGAGELNYSSDVDLIFLFDDTAAIRLDTDDALTLLSRMAKQFIKLMQERTADGYVFRMDLRLRPDPSSTPLVIPLIAALNYYESQGQNWERAAMIKARAVAGDIKAGEAFLKELGPFIWRKYLDFAAINDVQSIKRQIHAHKGHGEIAVLGHNIKLGRGGIREIEFFAQTQQLIAGGRNDQLRVNETIAALQALHSHNWIEQSAVEELSEAYWFLRDVEHRLQMVDDGQTHTLPANQNELKRIAIMCGQQNVEAFENTIRSKLETVEKHYSALFETAPDLASESGNLVFTGDGEDPDTIQTLEKMGFANAIEIIKIIKTWHVARIPALRATQARELLTELVPDLLRAFSKAGNPDDVLYKFDRFLSGLPAGIQLFSILKNNPDLSALVIKILSAAPRLAEQIAHRPHVFDAMIDPQFGQGEISEGVLEEILGAGLKNSADYEAGLDEARRFTRQTQFMIGCQLFAGTLSARDAAKAFSSLAEVVVCEMLKFVRQEFEKTHGNVDGAKLCILAMGRLGSRELTASSDLDLIFLYDYDGNCEMSDGEKPLATSQYFIRMVQRFISAMSAPTAEGRLFELDFRLRPSGNAGPLATHYESFLKYQREEAWVWETQALTRARVVAGDDCLVKKINKSIPKIIHDHSQKKNLEKEILQMRKLLEKEKGTTSPWHVKNMRGGFLDIEFIAQWLAIKDGTGIFSGTREILEDMRHEQVMADERETLLKAYDTYNDILQMERICLLQEFEKNAVPEGFIEIICSKVDMPALQSAEAHLKALQKEVRSIFLSLMQGKKKPRT